MRKYRIRYSDELVNNLEQILQDLENKSILSSNKFRDEIKSISKKSFFMEQNNKSF